MAHMASVWRTVEAESSAVEDPEARLEPPGGITGPLGQVEADNRIAHVPLPPPAQHWIHEAVSQPIQRCNRRGGKRLYVDKSLDSVFHLSIVENVFPGSRYVLLFRHVMDTIASGLEASPWGFQAYGYGPYVQATPHNTVAALASYWQTHMRAALAWEAQHPTSCFRVRYEDLVQHPEETVTAVQGFLGVPKDLSVLDRAFQRDHARGPGDYKVVHTSQVHARSIGHGKRVPVAMLPPPLLEAVNDTLVELGYPRLDRSWNSEERAADFPGETIWSQQLRQTMAGVVLQPGGSDAEEPSVVALVAEDHRTLRWVIDIEAGKLHAGDGEVDSVVIGSAEDLVLMLTGEENLGVLIRTGRVRYLAASAADAPEDVPSVLARILRIVTAALKDSGPDGRDP